MKTKLYPEYKDAAQTIINSEDDFFTDKEIMEMLGEVVNTNDYQFKLMALIKHLLIDYNIDFIRASNTDLEKGYKKATSEESLKHTVQRLSRKVRNTAVKQAIVLGTIDRGQLSIEDSKMYDQSHIKNGLLLSYLQQSSRKIVNKESYVRIDTPKISC